jgi:PDZ domain-containing protein
MTRRLFLPACLAILGCAAAVVPLPVFVERPRAPVDLTEFVTVAAPQATPIDGAFLLTAVNLRRAALVDLVAVLFDDDADLVSIPDVLPPGEADRAFFDRQREVFADTAELAAAIGLDAAGYDALAGAGAQVLGVQPDSPADGVLEPGDIIVAVDEAEVDTSLDLVQLVTDPDAEGSERELTIRRQDTLTRLSVLPRPLTREVPQLGVQAETVDLRVDLPFEVLVDAGRIGGPSAGLLVALTVYDLAAPADLAAGRRVAGTGAIAPSGAIGPIGGLAQKVVSADQAGADVFLVPLSQEPEARAALPAGSDMALAGVATFDDAVDALTGTR